MIPRHLDGRVDWAVLVAAAGVALMLAGATGTFASALIATSHTGACPAVSHERIPSPRPG